MRSMSFMHTTEQMRARTKTVTRRLGWEGAYPGQRIRAVEKSQGLKKGEHQVLLGVIEVVSARRERLEEITQEDVVAEGFPEMTREQFIEMFCRHMRPCYPRMEVTRIEFRHLTPKDR